MHATFIVKVTRGCNLRCTYCSDWRNRVVKMAPETRDALFQRIAEHDEFTNVTFVWHGGEPLLCGRRYFEELVAAQSVIKAAGKRVRNCLQTNGLLLDAAWLEFFEAHNFHIGLSIDGPSELQDVQRPRPHDRPSSDPVLAALRLLQGSRTPHGTLCVVTHRTYQYGARRLFDFVIEQGIKSFGILAHRPELLPDANYCAGSDYISHDEFIEFDQKLFDAWFEHDDTSIEIRDFTEIMASLLGKHPKLCTLAGNCIGSNFSVEMEGDVYHCDLFNGDPTYRTGSVAATSAGDLFAGRVVSQLVEADGDRLARFGDCSYINVCHGGCPADDYARQRTPGAVDSRCCGRGELIDHIARRIEGGVGSQLRNPSFAPGVAASPTRTRIPVSASAI